MSIFICQYCGGERKNKKSLIGHESFCKKNPDRSNHDHSSAGRRRNVKSKITKKDNVQKQKCEYDNDPNFCKKCKAILCYEKRKNKFCSQSCAATYNNKKRDCKSGPDKGTPCKVKIGKTSFSRKQINELIPKYKIYRQKCKCCSCYFWEERLRKTCSDLCKSKIFSTTAKNNPKMGGNKNTRAYGWYDSKHAGKVWLESSWEYKVAKSLDDNNISWIRPNYLKYNDRRYYPDFYLKDYRVYLDPKNPFLQEQDKEKISLVEQQNNVNIILLNKNELNWEEIKVKITAL